MPTGIDRTELVRLLEEEQAQIVDVLPVREFDESHIPGAMSIPLKRLTEETVATLRRDRPVVVYCHDGL
jgi:rhodanese-related sulfurtransferase